ncbi:MAG: diacylglycerol kinase family lipid kinase [Anaerolineae bacterium]|nr:diacylglycerol kinase family lipid kinase [Gemmatimonadaceae bacterium]
MELLGPVLLIANPGSRRGEMLRELAMRAFRDAGVHCDLVVTEQAGHGASVAAERGSGYQAVFALGGDGTAIEVLGALAGTNVLVGLLAGGTGNLVARSLGVPLSIERAVPALLKGKEARIDLGLLNGEQYFAFTAGIGIDAAMVEATTAALKRRYGVSAYIVAATRAMLRQRTFRVRIEADGETIESEAVAVVVANFGTVLNDLVRIGPDIVADDGLLDLCIFSPKGVPEALALAWRLFRKDFSPHRAMRYRRGARFSFDCTPEQTVQTDGEVRGRTPITIEVRARAARVLSPK